MAKSRIRSSLVAVVGLCILLVASSCTPSDNEQPYAETELQLVNSLFDPLDLDALAEVLHEDVTWVDQSGPPFIGKMAALGAFSFWGDKFAIRMEHSQEKLDHHSADQKTLSGSYVSLLEPRGEGEPQQQAGEFSIRFARHQGEWKIDRLVYGTRDVPADRVIPLLPPSGAYTVGVYRTGFVDEDTGRQFSYTAWYPGAEDPGQDSEFYRTGDELSSVSEFHGFPLFAVSYQQLVPTYSFAGLPLVDDLPRYPVLFFHHGYGGIENGYQMLCEELASHGFVVISLSHAQESAYQYDASRSKLVSEPGNAFFSSRVDEASSRASENAKDTIMNGQDAATRRQAYADLLEVSPLHQASTLQWSEDTDAVLAHISRQALFNDRLDLDRIGVFGHSVGGAVAVHMALTSSRIAAAVNLDGFQFGNVLGTKSDKPVMFAWEQGASANAINAQSVFEQDLPNAQFRLFPGFSHSDFTDQPYFEGIWEPGMRSESGEAKIREVRSAVLAFFKQVLVDK